MGVKHGYILVLIHFWNMNIFLLKSYAKCQHGSVMCKLLNASINPSYLMVRFVLVTWRTVAVVVSFFISCREVQLLVCVSRGSRVQGLY